MIYEPDFPSPFLSRAVSDVFRIVSGSQTLNKLLQQEGGCCILILHCVLRIGMYIVQLCASNERCSMRMENLHVFSRVFSYFI